MHLAPSSRASRAFRTSRTNDTRTARAGRALVELVVAAMLLGIVGAGSLQLLDEALRLHDATRRVDAAALDIRSGLAVAEAAGCHAGSPNMPATAAPVVALQHATSADGALWRITTVWTSAFDARADQRFPDILWGRPCD